MEKVLLIHPEGNTFNNPTLKCIIDLLCRNEVDIDIRYFKNSAPIPSQAGTRLLPFGRLYRKVKTIILSNFCSSLLAFISVWLEWLFIYEKYDLIIGIDREGLIEAAMLSRITGSPFVFFSFEIMFESETSYAYKILEREAAKHVQYWFVQDALRAEHLQLENKLDLAKRVLLPLASTGEGVAGVNRLRDHLGIPSSKNVVLAMGSISAWSMASEIISSVSSWPDEWVLIVHERYGRTAEALALLGLALVDMPKDKLYFSNQASIMVDGMDEIMSGVSVGLAFYRPDNNSPYTGNNLKYLGLASGKISTFLRYGVPVIMNNVGVYSDLAEKYKFGIAIERPSCIGAILPLLLDPSWGGAAQVFYKTHLDFSNFQEDVWAKLNGVGSCGKN